MHHNPVIVIVLIAAIVALVFAINRDSNHPTAK